MSDLVAVEVACPCPGTPHDTDTVSLYPDASLELGYDAIVTVRDHTGSRGQLEAKLARIYLRYGIAEWTFTGEGGKPVPLTDDNVSRLLPFGKGGYQVAQRADDLYGTAVTSPLAPTPAKSSRTGRTGASTSATNGSSRRRDRTSSARSSASATDGEPSPDPTG